MKPTDSQLVHVLPEGTELPNNYIIQKVLGEGGFGITYSGIWNLTGEKVAIKEYFPTALAHRECEEGNPHRIIPFYGMEEPFEKGRQHFLNEAIILKEFQNLNSIVSVKDVIETNDTVYLVMEFIDGITLKQYVKENGALSFDELLPLIKPVILSLTQIHRQGLIHRDISPENIMVGIDNQLHLIDFGAASIENVHDDKTMTVILKSGYAPPEQYLSDGKQGAWTDIYALCSTIYMALTGFAPPESIRRFQQDEIPPLANHANITSWQAAAIEKGMSLTPADRFQNMESLYQALIIPPLEILSNRQSYHEASIEENRTVMKQEKQDNNTHGKPKPFVAILLIIFAFAGVLAVGALLQTSPFTKSSNVKNDTSNLTTDNNSEITEEPTICSMTNLVGFSLTEAKEQLRNLDDSIKVKTTWVYNNSYAANTVIGQSVQNGTDFTKGSLTSILLTISKGTEPTTESTTEATTESTTKAQTEQSNQTQSGSGSKEKSTNTKKTTTEQSTNEDEIKSIPFEDEYDTIIMD